MRNFAEMRMTFPSADPAWQKSGKIAVVFNIKRNDFRLITAVHQSEKTVKDQDGNDKVVEAQGLFILLL